MTPQKPRRGKFRPAKSSVFADGFRGIARTGRVEAAGAAKEQAQTHLVYPNACPQNPAQDLFIQDS